MYININARNIYFQLHVCNENRTCRFKDNALVTQVLQDPRTQACCELQFFSNSCRSQKCIHSGLFTNHFNKTIKKKVGARLLNVHK